MSLSHTLKYVHVLCTLLSTYDVYRDFHPAQPTLVIFHYMELANWAAAAPNLYLHVFPSYACPNRAVKCKPCTYEVDIIRVQSTATYKAYLKALHTRIKRGYCTRLLLRSINGRWFSAVFSTTSELLAINELPGRSSGDPRILRMGVLNRFGAHHELSKREL